MPTYKTPGVYVEEISVFPPAVAEVETAIPAFIGYTEKAARTLAGDLESVPTRIKSLLEFEYLFGKGPLVKVEEVELDEAKNFVRARIGTSFYLYDSMRLFFDNGGGDCYIVSVGNYSEAVDADRLKEGVALLKKFDEPTILLFPDAVSLAKTDLASVQQTALAQCAELGDRVAVLDTLAHDALGKEFRDELGINNLKYGAAYSPWLKLNYSKNVGYSQVKEKVIKKGTTLVTVSDLAKVTKDGKEVTDTKVTDLIAAADGTAKTAKEADDVANENLTLAREKKKLAEVAQKAADDDPTKPDLANKALEAWKVAAVPNLNRNRPAGDSRRKPLREFGRRGIGGGGCLTDFPPGAPRHG